VNRRDVTGGALKSRWAWGWRVLASGSLYIASAGAQGASPPPSGPPLPQVHSDARSDAQGEPLDTSHAAAQQPIGPPAPVVETAPPVPEHSTPDPLARTPLPAYKPVYRNFADAALLLGAMANAEPDVASMFELGPASDGRPVPAIEIAPHGDLPAAARPTVFLFGALDGRSQSGAEDVLAIVHRLLEAPERIPADVAVIAVPWGAPEGLDVLAAGGVSDGANTRPVDDDRDGAFDEDPPDDLNDDGVILQMLIEDPQGEWVRCSDGRFLAPAGPLDQPRYKLTWEGRDDDGDGRFNEDGPGGVVIDRNFPLGRRGPWLDPRCGVVPMSEPLTRAIADLVLKRHAAAVLVFQGNHGGVAMPGGVVELDPLFAADRPVYERLARQFAAASGRALDGVWTAREAIGADRPGCALDWFAGVAGALSLEIAPWGPHVDSGAEVAARDARFNGTGNTNGSSSARGVETRPAPADEMRAWAAWLDNRHGGIGFDDWQPIGPAAGVTALLGGWRPHTLFDPPEETLPRALHGSSEFVIELLESLPHLDLHVLQEARDDDLCRLRVRIENGGHLPTGPSREHGGVVVELVMPAGARLLAGDARVELPRLVGGESGREVGWTVLAPPGSVFTLRATAPWCSPVARESKP
jgi:hypothetical protein